MIENHKHFIDVRSSSLILAAVTSLLLVTAQARTWTSTDGSKTFEAELKSYDATTGKVTVTLPNGRPMSFFQDKLSEADITYLKENGSKIIGSSSRVKELPDVLPDSDGEEADMSLPVQVYILLGQSNMLGFGKSERFENGRSGWQVPVSDRRLR
ncbi:MAG: hypothetical protein GWQ05_03450 [Verrucomicrobiaceae bacterium]|nr:hypothetical protein [Verrucomicrobiaceae bacterium]NCF90004.1 hypothetical protein [Verrucomicrobiaceae bacterium]